MKNTAIYLFWAIMMTIAYNMPEFHLVVAGAVIHALFILCDEISELRKEKEEQNTQLLRTIESTMLELINVLRQKNQEK